MKDEDVLLTGPSNYGLATPALSTIASLKIIATTMLTYNINLDFLVISKVIAKYGEKAEEAFLEIDSGF